jgi:hypothetical protein
MVSTPKVPGVSTAIVAVSQKAWTVVGKVKPEQESGTADRNGKELSGSFGRVNRLTGKRGSGLSRQNKTSSGPSSQSKPSSGLNRRDRPGSGLSR